jgi:hypothetical protein
MQIQIKNRWDGSVIFEGEFESLMHAVTEAVSKGKSLADANLAGAYLASANLARANLARANLARADFAGANLADANLAGAYLAGAYLARADFAGANLADANLAGAYLARADFADAKGIDPWRASPLMMLLDQPGKIRAYKVVTAEGYGPFNGGLRYEVGRHVSVDNASTDPAEQCGTGIHVASFDWCAKEYRDGYRILLMEFEAKDIACIPLGTDGKFRLHRATVVGEVDVASRGLVKP